MARLVGLVAGCHGEKTGDHEGRPTGSGAERVLPGTGVRCAGAGTPRRGVSWLPGCCARAAPGVVSGTRACVRVVLVFALAGATGSFGLGAEYGVPLLPAAASTGPQGFVMSLLVNATGRLANLSGAPHRGHAGMTDRGLPLVRDRAVSRRAAACAGERRGVPPPRAYRMHGKHAALPRWT